METNKKVSIVIPVYKAADTITRCVESLEKNTYKNLQIILVEDCSGDQTINICKKLANTYDNVLCIENDQNHGVALLSRALLFRALLIISWSFIYKKSRVGLCRWDLFNVCRQ